jgi:hypothetical protein
VETGKHCKNGARPAKPYEQEFFLKNKENEKS